MNELVIGGARYVLSMIRHWRWSLSVGGVSRFLRVTQGRLLAIAVMAGETLWPGTLKTEVCPLPTIRKPIPIGLAHYGVATQHPMATAAAAAILRQGGTAADAAVGAAFVLGVVAPDCSGIGGGGFAVVADQPSHEIKVFDFRETAPRGLDATALETQLDRPDPQKSGRLVGVPGEVRGLFDLHRRYGRLPMTIDMAPAISAADDGYAVAESLARNAYAYRRDLQTSAGLQWLFDPRAKVPALFGSHVTPSSSLARTLRTLAFEGADSFYRGAIAQDLIESVASAGGWLSATDLASYKVIEREPLRTHWEGYDVVTMPPPSAGGLLLVETLKSLSSTRLRALGFDSAGYVHELAEVFRGGLADRMRSIGDPSYAGADLGVLTNDDRMAHRSTAIDRHTTHPLPSTAVEEHGTSHLVVVDGAGSIVSLTTTVGDAFGSRVVAERSGIILNDELVDFSSSRQYRPFQVTSALSPAASPNSPRPGARPVSSMTPTIVFQDGFPILALGGAGGLRIATGVTQALLARLVFSKSPAEAIAAPRFHTPYQGPTTELEFGTPQSVARGLLASGEHVEWFANFSAVQMIAIEGSPDELKVIPAADPRFGGTAEGR